MKEYQLFILTLEGHVKAQYDLICADDDDAKRRAAKFFTVFSVELWDGPRRLVRFPSRLECVGAKPFDSSRRHVS